MKVIRNFMTVFLTAMLLIAFTACAANAENDSSKKPLSIDAEIEARTNGENISSETSTPTSKETELVETTAKTKNEPVPAIFPIIKLNWNDYFKFVLENHIKGSAQIFEEHQFVLFVPNEFEKQTIKNNNKKYKTLGRYTTADQDYAFEIRIGDLPYNTFDRSDLKDFLQGSKAVTVYDAEINGVSYTDIEDYQNNTLTLLTEARNYSPSANKDQYLMFVFSPINTKYETATMTALASINYITPPSTEPSVDTEVITIEEPETEPTEITAPDVETLENPSQTTIETEPAETTTTITAPVVETQPVETEPIQTIEHEHTWMPITKTIHHDAEYTTVHHNPTYQTIHHDPIYQTIHHEAIYEQQWVLDEPAWTEERFVEPGYDEDVYESHIFCGNCFQDFGPLEQLPDDHILLHYILGDQFVSYFYDTVKVDTIHHEDVYETIEHQAVGHFESVKIQDAWDETVMQTEGWDEQFMTHPAWEESILVKAAYDETITIGYKCAKCGETQ